MSQLILVLGGARSGKSSFAEQVVDQIEGNVTYIATAQPQDEEMEARIAAHRQERPKNWTTIEAGKKVGGALRRVKADSVVLIDCLTVLVSNLLLADNKSKLEFQETWKEISAEIDAIIEKIRNKNLKAVVVSNEVGKGVVPPSKLGRKYRDILGWINQLMAQEAEEVYVTYAGLPVEIKELSQKASQKWKA